jgi:Holliday junction DNA helicase RuvA
MINFICGKIIDANEGSVVLQSGDIGYDIAVSNTTLGQLPVGKTVQLYTYLHVKEDGIALYGFASVDEKAMFLRLITVSGIGCKAAIAILSGATPVNLANAIYNGDTRMLTAIKGLGKKTAERLILELREKVSVSGGAIQQNSTQFDKEMTDAIEIVMSLGLNRAEAERRILKSRELGANTTQELFNMAFKL